MIDLNIGAHGLQSLDVQIHRALADRATAGQRHARLAEAGNHRPQHQNRRTHRLDQIVMGFEVSHVRRFDLDAEFRVLRHGRTGGREQLDHGADVGQIRHVAQTQRLARKQRGTQDRQRGIFRTRNLHLALEGLAAGEFDFIHGYLLTAAHCSGVRVCIDSACISSRIRSPSAL